MWIFLCQKMVIHPADQNSGRGDAHEELTKNLRQSALKNRKVDITY